MRILFFISLLTNATGVLAQYPFEKFTPIASQEFRNWKIYDKLDDKGKIDFTITISEFYADKDTLTVQLSSFKNKWDTSFIRIFRNKQQIQKIFEPFGFYHVFEPARVLDVDGDGLKDIKIVASYGGTGLAMLNHRVIYLFQKYDGTFVKISYLDKMGDHWIERDLDNDGKFEIITMTLNRYQSHNYWTFNLYNFDNGKLVNKNEKFGYPIMTQFLRKPNYRVTDKISPDVMKTFSAAEPEYFSKY
jgi:hypothetical protein